MGLYWDRKYYLGPFHYPINNPTASAQMLGLAVINKNVFNTHALVRPLTYFSSNSQTLKELLKPGKTLRKNNTTNHGGICLKRTTGYRVSTKSKRWKKRKKNRGSIYLSFNIHFDTRHTNQKTQAKYTNVSPEHNHLWLDKTALMMCGCTYCKQTLLIRFVQYCFRFK